ncbi:gas vesicle protein [filamentous cyanobacterium CCP5]|nr:gas vesicle protein [filamentous cyanobacterium CCP5]
MMTAPLYLYTICQVPAAPLCLPAGLQGDTLLVTVEEVGAIAEPNIDLAALQADDQRLLTAVLSHDRVIGDLFQQTTVLPLRFGTQIASPEGLRTHLQDNLHTYRTKLKQLSGKVEHQLKLEPETISLPPLPDGLKGRDYFLAKKQRLEDQAQALQQQQQALDEFLEHIRQAHPGSLRETQEDAARVFVLIDRAEISHLHQQVQSWQATRLTWQITLSEALPPYHFV